MPLNHRHRCGVGERGAPSGGEQIQQNFTRGEGGTPCHLLGFFQPLEKEQGRGPGFAALLFPDQKKKKVREPLRPHLPGPDDGVTNAALAANLGLETCV